MLYFSDKKCWSDCKICSFYILQYAEQSPPPQLKQLIVSDINKRLCTKDGKLFGMLECNLQNFHPLADQNDIFLHVC